MRLAVVSLTLYNKNLTREPFSGDTRGAPHKYVKKGVDGDKQ